MDTNNTGQWGNYIWPYQTGEPTGWYWTTGQDKSPQAFKIAKSLVEGKIVTCSSAKAFIELVEKIAEII